MIADRSVLGPVTLVIAVVREGEVEQVMPF